MWRHVLTGCILTLPGTLLAGTPLPEKPAPSAQPNFAEAALAGDLFAQADTAALEPVASGPAGGKAKPAPSQNVTVNLINRLVKKGILSEEDAGELIKQAEADALTARADAVAVATQAVQAAQAEEPPMTDDSVRVTYIPESVKAQMREQIKSEIMDKARDENWASPRLFPTWASRIKISGDFRLRTEGIFFPDNNDNEGAFPNFNSINTGAPFDVAGTVFSPQYNVDQDRNRLRIRARLALEADLSNGFTLGMRFGTGESNTPTSMNQSLGLAGNGQGGNFSKYALWLDRGFLKYEYAKGPGSFGVVAGRFDNPFFTASEIQWDDDIGFDGAALRGKYKVADAITLFGSGGAFPVYNTDLNYATNQPAKFESQDKWLYAVQGGMDIKLAKQVNLKLAIAYYDFDGVEGKLSKPFVPLTTSDAGDTDATRPAFAQRGNTYRPLRNIIPTVDNDFGTSKQYQYFGLATPYRNISLTGRLDLNYFEPVQISFLGEWIRNTAFERGAIDKIAVNNRAAVGANGTAPFDGGDTAWYAGVKVGKNAMEKAWDWNVALSYRHVESDAVIDGFNDSDFNVYGGTNTKGYVLSGSLAVSPNVWFNLRWLSANEIAGPPFKTDYLMLDLNGKF